MAILKLAKMSSFVFDLPPEYRNILKFLSENGPSNTSNIAAFTKKSENHPLDRWAIKKRIYGTARMTGLFSADYLFEKLEEKHRYSKQERTYYLESKGIMASIATTPLARNYFFNKALDAANKNTKGKKFPSFIKEYITSQIELFLAYHYLEGIQLTWQTNFTMYFYDFFTDMDSIDLTIQNREIFQEFSDMVENFVTLHSTFEYLNGKVDLYDVIFPSITYYSGSKPKTKEDKKHWRNYVYLWYIGLWQNLLDDLSKEPRMMNKKKSFEYSTDSIAWTKLAPRVKKKLESLGIKGSEIRIGK